MTLSSGRYVNLQNYMRALFRVHKANIARRYQQKCAFKLSDCISGLPTNHWLATYGLDCSFLMQPIIDLLIR